MIDIQQIDEMREGFYLLSRVLDYPEEMLFTDDFWKECQEVYPQTDQCKLFLQLVEQLRNTSLLELKEHYSNIFELNKRVTLYMSYARFEDSRERGTLLAKLKMIYEMFGVELDSSELTDFLPVILEFLSLADIDGDERVNDLTLLFSVVEDGSYELLQKAQEFADEPYIQLVKLARTELKKCIKGEEVSK